MCWCTPTIRTPCCGKIGCHKPDTKPTSPNVSKGETGVDPEWWVSEVGHWDGSIAPMVTWVKGKLVAGVFIPYPTMQQMQHQKQHHQGAHAPHPQQPNPAKDHG